jgi:plasmid stabilization system protein ParE
MMEISLSEDALADLNDGFWFYESQGDGLGDYFASSLRTDIEGLKITAGIHRRTYLDYHRLVCRIFPYAIYYTFEDNCVTVWAVVDCQRDPDWIRDHLNRV